MPEPEADEISQAKAGGPLLKRGITWGLLVCLLIATLLAAVVLAYLITTRNFPAH